MPASRFDLPNGVNPVRVSGKDFQLDLGLESLVARRNGIEFKSDNPLPIWRELNVVLHTDQDSPPHRCNGIVVSCTGDRHLGYSICLLFLNLPPSAEQGWAQIVNRRTV